MVLESDIGRCAIEDIGPQEGWIVRSHIGWRGEHGGLGLLQMVSEPDTRGCASKDVRLPMRVDCEMSHQLKRKTKQNILCKSGETSL